MMDDSLDDTVTTVMQWPTADAPLIEELRRRGFFVYPKDHVRVFGAQYVINERDMRFTEMKDYIRRKLALQIGEGLHEAGALAESSRHTDAGEIIAVNCVVVLPKGARA